MSKYKFFMDGAGYIHELEKKMEDWEREATESGITVIEKTLSIGGGFIIVMFEYSLPIAELLSEEEQVDLEEAIKEIDEDKKTTRPKPKK